MTQLCADGPPGRKYYEHRQLGRAESWEIIVLLCIFRKNMLWIYQVEHFSNRVHRVFAPAAWFGYAGS